MEKVSWKGLNLVHQQYKLAKGSLLCPDELPIGQCSGAFQEQYGLPCKHIIHDEYLRAETSEVKVITLRPLEISLFDNQWIIRKDLVSTPERNYIQFTKEIG